MAAFFAEYGLFLLKATTIVVAIVVVIVVAASAGRKASHEGLEVESLNKKYKTLANELRDAVSSKDQRKKAAKERKKEDKAAKNESSDRPRSFIIDFKGDLKASAVASLREEVSAILDVADEDDEVIVRLENHGGMVHEHVCVDKVAASGGYLMACVASKIYAAPFAIIGSIGVLAQLPNFNRLLDSHGIDFEQITAGKHKRTVTMFGKNTDEDRAKLKEELEDVHALFKDAIAKYRTELDLDKVATGEYWYGARALDLGLTDEISTSDELLSQKTRDRDLYRIEYKIKQPLQKRLMGNVDSALEKAHAAGWRRKIESYLPR